MTTHPQDAWERRYSDFAARKEREAREATIAPLATDVDRAGKNLVRVGNPWSLRMFGGPFYMSAPPAADVPAASLVFVQSRDGNTGAPEPGTLGGGDTDKHLVYEGLSRVAADAVIAGATTVRGDVMFSVWRDEIVSLRAALGKPRHPAQVVATLRGLPFDEALLFNVPDVRVFIITVASCAEAMRAGIEARPWIRPIVMAHQADLAAAFRELRRLGIERASAVGGRTVARALIDAGLVQDLYLTTSPRRGGEPNTPMYPKPLDTDLVVRKLGTGPDAGVVFEHRLL